jgi:hypothetical protein
MGWPKWRQQLKAIQLVSEQRLKRAVTKPLTEGHEGGEDTDEPHYGCCGRFARRG